MNSSELKERTMDFAVRVLKMVDALPKTTAGRTVGGTDREEQHVGGG